MQCTVHELQSKCDPTHYHVLFVECTILSIQAWATNNDAESYNYLIREFIKGAGGILSLHGYTFGITSIPTIYGHTSFKFGHVSICTFPSHTSPFYTFTVLGNLHMQVHDIWMKPIFCVQKLSTNTTVNLCEVKLTSKYSSHKLSFFHMHINRHHTLQEMSDK